MLLLGGQPFHPHHRRRCQRPQRRPPRLAPGIDLIAGEVVVRCFEPAAECRFEVARRQGVAQRLAVAQHRHRDGAIEPEALDLLGLVGLGGLDPEQQDGLVVDGLGREAAAAGYESADLLRLQDVVVALEPLAEPGIERRLQGARDLVGGAGRHAALRQQRRQQVRHHREAERVVQKIEQRREAWHLGKVDLESILRGALRHQRRLAELNTVGGERRETFRQPAPRRRHARAADGTAAPAGCRRVHRGSECNRRGCRRPPSGARAASRGGYRCRSDALRSVTHLRSVAASPGGHHGAPDASSRSSVIARASATSWALGGADISAPGSGGGRRRHQTQGHHN